MLRGFPKSCQMAALEGVWYLFARGDVEALAAALVELLSQPQKSADYGQLARKTVEQRFGLGIVGERLADALASRA